MFFFAHLQVTEPVAAPQPVGRGRAVFRGIDGNRVQATQPIGITGRDSKQGVEQLQHLSIENGNRSSQTCVQRSTQVETQRIPAEGANQQREKQKEPVVRGDNSDRQSSTYREERRTRPETCIVKTGKRLINN